MRTLMLVGFFVLASAGCVSGGESPFGPVLPQTAIGVNLGIGDLVNRPNAERRVATYLDEISAAGYAHEVRVLLNRDWGPQMLRVVIPVIRAKGFRLLAILTPGNQGGRADVEADRSWITWAMPLMVDVLMGVQLANEQWQFKIDSSTPTPFPPQDYVRWHRALTPTIRLLAPGVPLVEGDIDGMRDTLAWWEEVQNAGGIDAEVLSWHIYTSKLPPDRGDTIWITEAGDARDCIQPAVKCFLYVWAGDGIDARWAKRPGGGILPYQYNPD